MKLEHQAVNNQAPRSSYNCFHIPHTTHLTPFAYACIDYGSAYAYICICIRRLSNVYLRICGFVDLWICGSVYPAYVYLCISEGSKAGYEV